MATKTQPTPEAAAPGIRYKKKQEASTMFDNVIDRFDVFVHASVDEHKACFKNTIHKVKEMPKAIKESILSAKKLSCNKCNLGIPNLNLIVNYFGSILTDEDYF